MRFETDVLTLREDIFGHVSQYECAERPIENGFFNSACRDSIVAAGWVLPRARGSKIVLVFSTTSVRGASRTFKWQLQRAGRVALRRRPGLLSLWNESEDLWWWPEVVCD